MKVNNSLKILFVINSIFVFAAQLLSPLYAIYVQRIGDPVILASSSISVFLLSSTFFLVLVSKWGKVVKEKELMLAAGYIIRAIGWLAYIFVRNPAELVLLQVLFGLGEALGTPAFNAVFAEHVDKNNNVEEYADWSIISNTTMALGSILGGLLVAKFGFDALFVTMSIMATVSFVSTILLPKKIL